MEADIIEVIRAANAELRAFLTQMASIETLAKPGGPLPDFEPLAEALDHVSRALKGRSLPPAGNASAPAEVVEYRENLSRLKDVLLKLGPQLTDRRQAIAGNVGKIQKALSWVASYNQTR